MLLILLCKILVTDKVASPGGARFPIKQGALQARRAMQPHGELNRFAPALNPLRRLWVLLCAAECGSVRPERRRTWFRVAGARRTAPGDADLAGSAVAPEDIAAGKGPAAAL
jgi:hypothetical protein